MLNSFFKVFYWFQIYPVVFLNGFFLGGLNELGTMDMNGHLRILLGNLHDSELKSTVKKRQEANQTSPILAFFLKLVNFNKNVKFSRI